MVIQATSSGHDGANMAKITINDKVVEVEKNWSHHLRGLHIVIVDPRTTKIQFAKCFDTYHRCDVLEGYMNYFETIKKEYIIIAAC